MPDEPTKAGAVVTRANEAGESVVLLITRKLVADRPVQWVLPMGTIEPGESPEHAAVRETQEEAGVRIVLDEALGDLDWRDAAGRPQRCRFFAARFEAETDWPEASRRRREWLAIEPAADRVVDVFASYVRMAAGHRSD